MIQRGAPVSYFATSEFTPWQWSRDGKVVVWFDGTTLAFREELAEILSHLAPSGLPPFGAIVLLLAALRGKLPDAWWMSTQRVDAPPNRIEDALDGIADMTSLSVRTIPALATSRGKAALVAVLLEAEPPVATPDEARALVGELERAPAEGELWALTASTEPPRILSDVEALGRGWKRFDAARFEMRLQIGLDRLPAAPEMEDELLPPSERARRLLEDLALDETHAGLAKLTRDLMAAVYFPHRLLPRDEAPSGGYSDVSNRGSLDRLLLSELAHDDLTLSVRVALNEALYMKREPPAEHPQGELALLLDSGLRLWGVPRVFATAVALALIAVQSRKRPVRVFRAKGGRIEAVELLTRKGLTEHLASLEPELNPARALSAFVAELDQQAGSEGVLVTEADTLEDPELRSELRRFELHSLYLASVSRRGSFRLFPYPRFDGKPLSAAELDLDGILPIEKPDSGTTAVPLLDPDHDPELPLILSVRPFPFLLPVRGKVERVAGLPSGEGACVTRDGRVLVWAGRGLGSRVVASGLPPGGARTLALTEARIVVVKLHRQTVRITRIDRSSETAETIERVIGPRLSEVLLQGEGDTILLVYPDKVDAVDTRMGAIVASCRLPGPSHRGFVMGHPWRRLVWDGATLWLEPIVIEGVSPEDVLWVFDWPGWEGPLALVRGTGIQAATGEVFLHGDVKGFSGASEDRTRIAARAADGSYLVFDLSRRTAVRKRAPELGPGWLKTRAAYVPTRNLRTRIVSVSASRTGGLVIGTAKGDFLELALRNDGTLVLDPCSREGDVRALKPHPVNPSYGCELSVACFGDGTRVFLDSRGPLHLKSSVPEIEEVSVIFTETAAAAWSSSGDVHGPRFFLGRDGTVSAEAMIEKIRRILERVA